MGRNIELLRKQEKNSRKPSEDLTKYSQKALPSFAENKQKRYRYRKSGSGANRSWVAEVVLPSVCFCFRRVFVRTW